MVIKNFSYSFEGNGEFKCKVDLVGAGDILESLKINQSGTSLEMITQESDYLVVNDANKSFLNEALYNYYNLTKNDPNNPSIFKGVLTNYFKKLNINFEDFSQNSDLIKKSFPYSLINGSNRIKGNGEADVNIPDIPNHEYYFSNYKLEIEINSTENNTLQSEVQTYITLGHLLLLVLATGGLYDKQNSKENPYVYIDVNPETNRCYTFPGHCSLDPTVCLIASEKLPFDIDSTFLNTLRSIYPFYDETSQDYGGKLMWTLVNVNFIASVLSKYQKSDNKGDVNFVDFIQDILNGISKACGGFNEFRIVPDDDTRCIRIFDDKRNLPPLKPGSVSPYTIIPVLGKDSLAYNFNYTSKISPNTATQIVIGAQAQPSNLGEEALAFSYLAKGLQNRLSPYRVTSTSDKNQISIENETQISEDRYKELKTFIENIYRSAFSETEIREEITLEERIDPQLGSKL